MSGETSYKKYCDITRKVVEKAIVEYNAAGEIIRYEICNCEDVLDMQIISVDEVTAGDELAKEIEQANEIASKAIKEYGQENIYLIIERPKNKKGRMLIRYTQYSYTEQDDIHKELYVFKDKYNTHDNHLVDLIKREIGIQSIIKNYNEKLK